LNVGYECKIHLHSSEVNDMVEKIKDEYGRMISVTHSSRYVLEHKIIPQFLYEQGIGFMAAVVDKEKNILSNILLEIMEEEGVENPYGNTPITVEPFKVENILVACIIFPKPEEEPLCYRSYAFFDLESQRAAYYCVEMGQEDGAPFLCGWNEAGVHLNYGGCSNEEPEVIEKMLRMFIDPEGDKTPKVQVAYAPAKNNEEDGKNGN